MPDPRADGPAADPLAAAILEALASEPPGAGMSLPRLGKRLGLGASVLMRCLATLGDARYETLKQDLTNRLRYD